MSIKKHLQTFFSKEYAGINTLTILALFFLLSYIIFSILFTINSATDVRTFPANGTFQLYNPLQRLDAGQSVGHDFPFFHGIGVPWLHFPLFKILGSNLFAAEFAKFAVSITLFFVSSFIFFWAYFRDKRKTIIATALFTTLAIYFIPLITPGNSLLGLRSTFPVLVAAALVWNTTRAIHMLSRRISYTDITAVILLACAFLCGTEQGLAALVAFVLVKGVMLVKQKRNLPHIALVLSYITGGTVALIFILTTILTAGHPIDAFRYALIDIPSDQGWYFGSPPNLFFKWERLAPAILHRKLIALYVFLAIIAAGLLWAHRVKKLPAHVAYAIFFMLAYGVITFTVSALGYFSPSSHLLPLYRMSGLIIAALTVQLIFSGYIKRVPHRLSSNKGIVQIFSKIIPRFTIGLLAGFLIVQTNIYIVSSGKFRIKDIIVKANQAPTKDDYFVLNKKWKNRVDEFKPYISKSSTIWSTYTSVYDSYLSDSLNPSEGGEDYIIHALGEKRRQSYLSDFIKSDYDYVITMRPLFFSYEEWLMSTTWSFYNHLLTHYDIVAKNDSHFLWKAKEASTISNQDLPTISAQRNGESFKLPVNTSDKTRLYEVHIRYQASTINPLLNKVPRYLVNLNNASAMELPVSVPSYSHEATFPVTIQSGEQNVNITTEVGGVLPGSFKIEELTYKEIPITDNNMQLPLDNLLKKKRNTWRQT